jgi:archaellum biogenesis ATPase FlaH
MFDIKPESGENRSQSAGETLQPLPNTRAATQESATGSDPQTQRIGSDGWLPSSRSRPCPVCSRTKDGDCRISADGEQVICHHPKDLAPGTVTNGWAFTKNTSDGRAGHFTIDKPRSRTTTLRSKVVPLRTPAPAAITLARLPQAHKQPPAHWPHGQILPYGSDGQQWVKVVVDAKGKRHLPHHIDANGKTISKAGPTPWPLWCEAMALEHGPGKWIVETEGEKCAAWFHAAALVAISQPGHDHKQDKIQARYTRLVAAGVAGVVYLADHDKTGSEKAHKCAAAAAAVNLPFVTVPAAEVWPGLPAGGSIDDAPGTAADRAAAFNAQLLNRKPKQQAQQAAPAEADPSRSEAQKLGFTELLEQALLAIRAKDLDTEMEIRAEIMGRFKRSDTQITASLFRLLTEQETGNPAGSTIAAEALDLDSIEGLDALLDGFIPANDLGLMYGAKGSGKTMAALAMAFAAIDGTGFLDHAKPAQQGPVLFIASDSGAPPLMAAMQDLGVADHAAIRGDHRSFYVWAHSARQGMESWCASINGCVQLLQFVKAKGIKLVLIDSAKTICAKAGISYLDNDSIAALLTFIKEAICPHTSVMILSHDGTEKGSHSGAKVWAEVPSIVHNIQQIPDAPHERVWRVVKNRMGTLRELRYQVGEDGRLEVCAGVETIQDGTAAVLQVLREASARGISSLSRAALVQEIQQRFRLAPKTIDNTLVRMVRAISPDVCRVASKRGHYKLSPRMAATVSPNNVSPNGKEKGKTPVIDSDLVTSRGVGSGNSRELKSEFPPTSHFPGGGKSSNASAGLGSDAVSSREVEMPIGGIELVEVFPQQTAHQSAPAWLPQLLAIRAANPTAHPSSIRHLLYGLHGIAVTVAQINAALQHLAESD